MMTSDYGIDPRENLFGLYQSANFPSGAAIVWQANRATTFGAFWYILTLCFWDIMTKFWHILKFFYIYWNEEKNRLLRFSRAVQSTLAAPARGSQNPGKMCPPCDLHIFSETQNHKVIYINSLWRQTLSPARSLERCATRRKVLLIMNIEHRAVAYRLKARTRSYCNERKPMVRGTRCIDTKTSWHWHNYIVAIRSLLRANWLATLLDTYK